MLENASGRWVLVQIDYGSQTHGEPFVKQVGF
jgi:hypothetical protein